MFCRIGALELTKTIEKVEDRFGDLVTFVGIGFDEVSLDEFISKKYFPKGKLYINPNRTIYKGLNFNKPGCYSCWGFCQKKLFDKYKELNKKQPNINGNFKGDFTQLGGAFLIDWQGTLLFQHTDKYLGDHASETDIISSISSYFDRVTLAKLKK